MLILDQITHGGELRQRVILVLIFINVLTPLRKRDSVAKSNFLL